MSVSALGVSAGVVSIYARSIPAVMLAISGGAFAMLCWGVNVDTLPSDLLPSNRVAQAVGFCGFMGSLGGIVTTAITGYVVQHYSYTPLWIGSALLYPLALGLCVLLLRGRKLIPAPAIQVTT